MSCRGRSSANILWHFFSCFSFFLDNDLWMMNRWFYGVIVGVFAGVFVGVIGLVAPARRSCAAAR